MTSNSVLDDIAYSAAAEHSDQTEHTLQSDDAASPTDSDAAAHADPDESSVPGSDRRRADRGEMEPLVEKYIRQGLTAPQIVDRVYNVDRLLTYHGKALKAERVYVIKNKVTDKEPSAPSQQERRSEQTPQSEQSVRSTRSPQTAPSQPSTTPVRLEDSFRDFKDLPPRKRMGRKETRNYAKLNSTVDIELWKRFEAERERRRWTATDMMELILFNAFGHPTLSYAEPEVTEPEPEETKTGGKRATKSAGRAKS